MEQPRQRWLADVDRLLDRGRAPVAAILLDAIDATAPAPHAAVQTVSRRARCALAEGNPAAALGALDAAIAQLGCSELFLWRARAWLAGGDPVRAGADAAIAAAAAPADADAAGLYAILLIEARQPKTAQAVLNRALAAGATGPALLRTLALAESAASALQPAL